jgi:hypothetical protein
MVRAGMVRRTTADIAVGDVVVPKDSMLVLQLARILKKVKTT